MEKYKIKLEEEKIVIQDETKIENIKFIALKGDRGDDGHTPVKGIDYFTEEDIESLNIPTKTSDLTNDSGYITNYVETDPIFSASASASITSNDITNWNNKSTFSGDYNDLTNKPTIPTKTSNLTNDSGYITKNVNDLTYYTKTSDLPTIPTKTSDLDNDSGFINNTVNNLTNYTLTTNLSTVATSGSYNDLSNKPTIPDVSNFITKDVNDLTNYTLTSNLSSVATSGNYNDLSNKPTIPTIPTNVSAFNNDVGYINSIPSEYITETELSNTVNVPRYDCPYIVGTQEEATNQWTGVAPFSSLEVGQEIRYYLPVAGTSSAATLNLTLSNGNTTGEIPLRRAGTSTVTTTFASGNIIYLTYDGEYWKVSAYVDTNTNTIGFQLRTNNAIFKNGASTSCYRYQILVETLNGLASFTSTSNKTAATKTQLSPQYIPGGQIRYYSATSTIASGNNFGTGNTWQQYNLDLRYSFNITNETLTSGKPVYIKMSINNDGTLSPVYSATSGGHPLVQDLPTTEDGYVYVRLGQAYSGYQMELTLDHPMYEFKDNKLKIYGG